MKKLFSILVVCASLFHLAGCGHISEESSSPSEIEQASLSSESSQESQQASGPASQAPTEQVESEPEQSAPNALVVYFSATGNTRPVAEALAAMQGADLYEIVPEQPYTDEDLNYNNPASRTSVEQNDSAARPAISGSVGNIEDYDVIYVGFPIWWGEMPRILYTFFDAYDLSGKTIAPFCTSGGSGISEAVQSIDELEPSATVTDGLRTSASNAENDLTEWLNEIGLAE